MNTRLLLLGVPALALAPLTRAAEEPAKSPEVVATPAPASAPALTLDSALSKASERHPELIAQSYAELAAAGLVEQAGFSPNPTLGVALENFAGSGRLRGADSMESTVQASQLIERGGKLEKRVALAGREKEVTEKSTVVRRAEVRAATAAAFVKLLADRRKAALAEEPLNLAKQTVRAVDKRVEAAVASPAEAARARAALAGAQAEYTRSLAQAEGSRATLACAWGGDPAEVGILSGNLCVPDALPDKYHQLAKLADHPRFDLQNSVVEGRRAAVSLEEARGVPDVTVGAGMRFMSNGSDVGVVLSASIPMTFRDDNGGNIRAARARLHGAEQSTRAVEVELRAAFTAAWQELAAAHTAASGLRRETLPATESAYTAVKSAYDKGALPLIDVLDAQRALTAVRREILDAESAYVAALVKVEALTDPNFSGVKALLARP